MDVAVVPSGLSAGLRMVNDPVLGLAERFDKRAMTNAPDLVGFLEYRSVLHPGRRVKHIFGLIVQQPQTVVRSPTATGRVNDENITVAFEDLWPLTDGHGDAFPG